MRRLSVPALLTALAACALGACGSSGGATHTRGLFAEGPPPSGPGIFRVPSGSMDPTLKIGARVKLSRGRPGVSEIVLFHPPVGAEEELCGPKPHAIAASRAACDASIPQEGRETTFVKRIVAGPGDTIYLRAGHVYRRTGSSQSFQREPDAYIRACAKGAATRCDYPTPITIPAGNWFLLGDNRGESDDSRLWGPIPAAWILGEAKVIWRPKL